MHTPTPPISLARYLFKRLLQQGTHAIHGVPDSYCLRALDHVTTSKQRFIPLGTGLSAAHAADGYARSRCVPGAVLTSYGPGAMAALAGMAGSWAEDVGVVHVVGTPARRVLGGLRWYMRVHGSLGGRTTGGEEEVRGGVDNTYRDMAAKMSVAQFRLNDKDTAPALIDEAIRECIAWSKPVYIELPSDMVNAPVDGDRLQRSLRTGIPTQPAAQGTRRWQVAQGLLQRLYTSRQPLILVDRGDGAWALRKEINEFIARTGIPTLCMPSGAGMVDGSLPSYFGIHSGPVGKIDTMAYVNSADFIIAFGPLFSDTQTLGWRTIPNSAKLATIGRNAVGGAQMDGKDVMRHLLKQLQPEKVPSLDNAHLLGDFRKVQPEQVEPGDPIDQESLYLRLSRFLQPGDQIVLGSGMPLLGGREFILPPGAQVIAPATWVHSSGYALPATLGAVLGLEPRGAGARRRTILVVGDGEYQAGADGLAGIVREKLDVTVFVINNGGYGSARHTHRLEAGHFDIPGWRYLEAGSFFGAADDYPVETYRVDKWRDLDALMESETFDDGKGLKMVEVVVGKYEVPKGFKEVFMRARENL